MIREELELKKQFVKDISDVMVKHFNHIAEIYYDVFADKYENIHEYLIIKFSNEAFLVRNCAGNSHSAILEEISRYMHGGYYDEIGLYLKYKKDSITLEQNS